ncbi:MAG: hypothetical protein JNM54_14460 [Candidatus Accumulibacter sp.]|jgi:hypothetical protein|uniref:hypothetical protein n=1 Tax=Accumulibacter sp. TaxID=2053492 RepID=UPI001A582CBE|nr:hypothetical protein [Accumulibacter sp.]MBL8369096.1 hypothetical protein [Accumulibacter sp.]
MEEYFKVRAINGQSTLNRAAYDEYQEALANRRAEGRYTLEEAALFIGDAIGDANGECAQLMLRKFMDAARSGALHVYVPRNIVRYQHGEDFASRVREFYEEARWCDLNKWLADNEPLLAESFSFPRPNGSLMAKSADQRDAGTFGARLNDAPAGLPKYEILAIGWPLPPEAPKMENILGNRQKWVDEACTKVGRAGKGPKGSHLWNPAILAACLATAAPQKPWVVGKGALTSVIRKHFPDYLEQWEAAAEKL